MSAKLVFRHAREGYDGPLTAQVTADGPHGAIGPDGISPSTGFPKGLIDAEGWLKAEGGGAYLLNPANVDAALTYHLTISTGRVVVSVITFRPVAVNGAININGQLTAGKAGVSTPEQLAQLNSAVQALADYALTGQLQHAVEVLPGVAENQARIDALIADLGSNVELIPGILSRQDTFEQTFSTLKDASALFAEVQAAYQAALATQGQASAAATAATEARDAAQQSAQEALEQGTLAREQATASASSAAGAVQASHVAKGHADSAGTSAATATAERQKSETAAGEAGSQASIAREQATASASSAGDASTAAQAAESARLEAGSARDGAAQSASAALTSQQQARSSADAAGQAASAARGSSLTAEAAASSAAGSAATASGHAVVADQRATAALRSQEAAQSSAGAAGQSASAAQASSLSAEASRGAAARIQGNPDFAQGLENWTTQTAGSEKDALALAPSATVQLVQDAAATGGRFLRVSQNWFEVAHRRPLPVNPARTYRLTARARRTAVETDRIWAGVACLGPELQLIAVRYGAYWNSTPWKPPMGEWDTKTGTFSGSGSTETNFPEGTAFVRPFFKFNGDSKGGTSDLDYLLWEDVTSETMAGGYAAASQQSAANAKASSDLAGERAEAARGWSVKAETAQTAANTAAGTAADQAKVAQQQAAAAVNSAAAAKSSSDAAGTQAQAAQASRVAAEAARDNAAGSAGTASERAKAAATSAEQAAASSTSAGQSAEAARGWTVKAESAQTAAQQSATNAAGSASAAQTQAGAAAGSAAQAKTHSDAAGSASSAAQTSALSAEASRGAAVRVTGNPDFALGLEGWTHYAAGTEAAVPTLTESAGVQLVALAAARGGRVLRPLSQYMTIGYRRPVPVDPARTYRLTVRARRTIDQGYGVAGVICLDAEGRELGRRYGSYFQNTTWNSPVGEWDTKTVLYTGTGDTPNSFPAGTVYLRPFFYANIGAVTNELDYLLFEDVTSETVAGGHAAASGQSASAASASATDAGKQAQAAQASRVAAETAQGNAQGAAAAALESKQAAAGSASAAGSSASNAASSSEAARLAKVAAEDARTQSQGSAAAAAQSASQASSSQTAAQQSAQASESSRVAAVAAQGAAETAKGQAANSAAAASTQAQAAQASAGQAGQSATAAETSRQSAATAQGAAEAARSSAAAASDKAVQAQQQASTSANTAKAQADAAQGSAVAAAGSAATAKTFMQASVTAQAFQPKYSASVPQQKDRLGNYWMPHFYDMAFTVQPHAEGMGDKPHISLQLPQAERYAAVAARVFLYRKPEDATVLIWGANGGFAKLNLISTVSQLSTYAWHTLVWDFQGVGVQTFDGFNPGDPIKSVSLYFHDAGAEKFLFGLGWLAAGTISAEPQTSRAEFTQYVDSLGAETVLKVQSGGVIAGIGLRAESGTGSAVNILADRFVVSTSGGSRQPFIVTAGQVAIDGNLIATGTVSASKITTGTLDASVVKVTNLNAGDIVSGYLSANRVRAGRLDSTNNTSYLDLDTGAVRLGSAEGPNLTYSPAAGFSLKGGVIGRLNLQASALSQLVFPESLNGEPASGMNRTLGGRKAAMAHDGAYFTTISASSWVDIGFYPFLPGETAPYLDFAVLLNFQVSAATTLHFMDSGRYNREQITNGNTAYSGLTTTLDTKVAGGGGSVSMPARAYPRPDGKGYQILIGVLSEGATDVRLSRLTMTMFPGRV